MNREELQERFDNLEKNTKNKQPMNKITVDEFAIYTKAYLALDLPKDEFARLAFGDIGAILANEKKWDWMIKAHDHYQAELQYEQDTLRIEEMERELRNLKTRKESYEKHRRTYGINAE